LPVLDFRRVRRAILPIHRQAEQDLGLIRQQERMTTMFGVSGYNQQAHLQADFPHQQHTESIGWVK
jgi:hypothetical protein